MSRRMNLFVCVVGIVAVLSSVCALQAATIYNANEDMYASETGASPSATFGGVWSLGDRLGSDPGTAFTLFTNHEAPRDGVAGWLGWDASPGGSPYFAVNTSASAFAWDYYRPVSASEPGLMGVKDIGVSPSATRTGVLRWTAPAAGTISTSTTINAGTSGYHAYSQDGVDINLLLNSTGLYNNPNTGSGFTPVNISTSGLTVAAGDVLSLIIGAGGNGNAYDLTGITSHVVTFNAVPEPSAFVLLSCGLIGLLAYAWRKRRQ